jgi:hypothetical protein
MAIFSLRARIFFRLFEQISDRRLTHLLTEKIERGGHLVYSRFHIASYHSTVWKRLLPQLLILRFRAQRERQRMPARPSPFEVGFAPTLRRPTMGQLLFCWHAPVRCQASVLTFSGPNRVGSKARRAARGARTVFFVCHGKRAILENFESKSERQFDQQLPQHHQRISVYAVIVFE